MLKKKIAIILLVIAMIEGKLNSQSIFGIDVSGGAQGTIDWQQVKTSGMIFAYAKSTEGFTFNDAQFVNNMTNGKNAGLIMGAYHFARPDNNSATDEATHFLSIASAYIKAGYLPPVLDIEDPYASKISLSALNTWIQQWMTAVQNSTGVTPIIYTSGYYATNLNSSLHVYKLWIADPDGSPTTTPNLGNWPTWAFKQYSWTGSVQGISSAVDLDVFNGDINTFNTLIGGVSTCSAPNAPVANYGDDNCPGIALTNTQNASLSFTSNGAVSFKAQVSKYPYGSGNIVFTSTCGTANPIEATDLVKGMLYRWNVNAYGANDCSSCESTVSNTKYFHLPPEITVNGSVSSPVSLCSGNITIATTVQTPGSGASINYKWYKDGAIFQQGNSLTSINVSSAGAYYLILDYSGSTNGCTGTISTSQSNSITVSAATPVTPSITISQASCNNNVVSFSSAINNGGNAPSYLWTFTGTGTAGSGGVTGSTFELHNSSNGVQVQCKLTSNAACANPVQVNSNTLTINCIVTAVQQVDTSQEIKVMPNPNNGSFDIQIKLTATRKVSFSLSTVMGQIVYQSKEFQMFGTQVKHIDQSRLPAGVYFLKIRIGMKSITKKIVIAR